MRTFVLLLALAACRTTDKPDDTGTSPDDTAPEVLDADGDGYPAAEDCDDADASIHPEAEEVCDGIDNDCDGAMDEGLELSWYTDADGDGHGDPDAPGQGCERPDGVTDTGDDCDDGDAAVNPDAAERCNGLDDDCDGEIDEELQERWYHDADGDGHGDPDRSTEDCDPGQGWVSSDDDCDDGDSSVHPGAEETCDGVDDDCDGAIDEGLETAWYRDADGDGWGDPAKPTLACAPGAGWVSNDGDCDDANSEIHPAAAEICNGIDDDCDGLTDDADAPVTGMGTWYRDADGDGWGDDGATTAACARPTGFVAAGGDCDDGDPAYHPGASEEDCTDPADYDCDGATLWADADGDGWAACLDCDDGEAAVNPDADEACNGIDDDCDGDVDEAGASGETTWYADGDGDGFGDASSGTLACDQPRGFVAAAYATDCDDGDAAVHPGAVEDCDGVDDDCDGSVDEGVLEVWFLDADGDGFGTIFHSIGACTQPSGYSADESDCDDRDAAVNPDATEYCNWIDDDCDGSVDYGAVDAVPYYFDGDHDGYGDASTWALSCWGYSDTVRDDSDCDDGDASIHPDADEVCDGVDQDCDGIVDDDPVDGGTWYADADGDGYGDPDAAITACSKPSGTVGDDSDCADGDATAYPGSTATEVPFDGVDQDCDGLDACTDLNCDGRPDLLFPSYRSDSTWATSSRAFYNTGYGFASSHGVSLPGVGPLSALVEDLDGDGYLDIVLGGYYDGTSRLVDTYVYHGSASGYSTGDRSTLATEGVIAIGASDLDQDGYTDLVFASHYGTSYASTSMIYWGSSAGFADSDRTELATYGAYDLAIADLDADGWDDLIFAQYYSGSTYAVGSYVYWGSSAGYATSDRTTLPTSGAVDVEVLDLNGDGWLDVAFACYYGSSGYGTSSYVYWGSATGPDSTTYDALYTYGAWDIDSGDLDQDGLTDLVFASYYSGSSYTSTSYVYWGNSGGYSLGDRASLTTHGARAVVAADMDQDGWDDLFFAQYYSGASYTFGSLLYWGSASGYSSSDLSGIPTEGAFRAQCADLDEDGWPDLIVNNYYDGSSYQLDSFVYYGSATGYAASDRDDLPVDGPWGHALVVGR